MISVLARTCSQDCKHIRTNWTVLQSIIAYNSRHSLSTRMCSTQLDHISKIGDPLSHPDFFDVCNMFTVKDLFDAKVHYGHKEGSLNDNMRPYIFGSRLGHLIIDLDQTAELLRQALNFTAHIAYRDGIILFIAKNPQTSLLVEKTARECKEFAHTRKWKLGTLTNSTREFKAVTRLPDLCIFLNTMETVVKQHTAVVHAAKMAIPTVGVVDTNCEPKLISYPVPGNDDTPCAIELYCTLFKEAILRGKQYRQKTMNESHNKM